VTIFYLVQISSNNPPMGNTLGIASDVAVETLAEIREKSKEQNLNNQIQKYSSEMKHLCNVSSSYIKQVTTFPPYFFDVYGNFICTTFQENGVDFLAILDFFKKSLKVIRFQDPVRILFAHIDPISQDILILQEITNEIQHFETKECEIIDTYFCKKVKFILSNFNSISISISISYLETFQKKSLIQLLNHDLYFMEQEDSQLFIGVGNKVHQFDFEKKEIVKIYDHSLKYVVKNGSYLCEKQVGFQKLIDDGVNRPTIPNFMCMSKDEIYFVSFDEKKSIGEVYLVDKHRSGTKNEPVAAFSILGFCYQMHFSEDSEFIFILEYSNWKECYLVVFSMREKKFVFRRIFKDPDITKIHLIHNLVLCLDLTKTFRLAEIIEINIPIRLKPYSFNSPTNMFFKFK
jgi:hypothetical protein